MVLGSIHIKNTQKYLSNKLLRLFGEARRDIFARDWLVGFLGLMFYKSHETRDVIFVFRKGFVNEI